jgi:hypothetical protein
VSVSARNGTLADTVLRMAESCIMKWCQTDITAADWMRHGISLPSTALSPLLSGMKAPPQPPRSPASSGPVSATDSSPLERGGSVLLARSEQLARTWYRKNSKPVLLIRWPTRVCSSLRTPGTLLTTNHTAIMVGRRASLVCRTIGLPSVMGTIMPPPKEVSTTSGIAWNHFRFG